jgi:hypothetical protein
MRMLLTTLLIVAQPALAFELPVPLPERPTRCVYEGVMPLTKTAMRWEYRTQSQGQYEIVMPDEFNLALLKRRLGDDAHSITHWRVSAYESHAGRGQNTRIQTVATIELSSGRSVLYESTLSLEVVCTGITHPIEVGQSWRCTESQVDGWSVTPAVLAQNSGEESRAIQTNYTLLKKATYESEALGKVDALVIESKDNEGNTQRVWRDPNAPWCELQKQRLKIGRVVGTVTLVLREPLESLGNTGNGPPASGHSGNPWLWGILALILISAFWLLRQRRLKT